MLATGDPAAGTLRPWLPALVVGGECHLFEPVYGMPVPGPGGAGVATARQAAADPAILRALSLPDRPYPVQAADVESLSVLVPAAPLNLARRMHLLDGQLAGSARLDLAIAASDQGKAALSALPGPADTGRVRLWDFPWETLRRQREAAAAVSAAATRELAPLLVAFEDTGPDGRGVVRTIRPLYAARLREFRGELEGPDGAKMAYLRARPAATVIADVVKQVPPEKAAGLRRLYESMKEDATYWLGVLTLAEGEYTTAIDYLGRMILQNAPDSRWADAARTNLATAEAALGHTARAIELLRADPSPQRFGSRLKAAQLERESAAKP
jgi:tetratricopeptide (TPR) repeat protein